MTRPDRWVVVKITTPVKITTSDSFFYKVFASWAGGYLDGDAWQINSGIKSVSSDDSNYIFDGFSGSKYVCDKDSYGFATSYANSVLERMIKRAQEIGVKMELLENSTDWLNLLDI
jgi:hypothetical protein